MFSYYGSKAKIILKYPKPKYNLIIEPFAGSARYSLLYWNKRIFLNDSYKTIFDIWKYLIKATKEQIENLPEMKRGDNVKNLNITDVEKVLMGFMVSYGVAYPRLTYNERASKAYLIEKTKEKIIYNFHKIRHWKVRNKDYQELNNVEATWFIDPPYQNGGHHYVKSKINYIELAKWCKSRKGQVIVCENNKADWMDFRPLVELSGQRGKTLEVIWTNTKPPGLLAPKEYLNYP